eukprot:CAMPEP_0206627650 /NCGR_PEP_ID=MMETSP0325_2-20121206/66085_2 /ASSEMBLY_ACC=CAM_ASM_000347 /TAXON_ID=2866 /ORGANISM="Crypthecodinium cohnii, Strain Seligo" /LENGTH=149 /DNA_ID=CAMNT_0054152321 /DNA_START=25 /DNA_END=470 /DNA_ORIENTATION=-
MWGQTTKQQSSVPLGCVACDAIEVEGDIEKNQVDHRGPVRCHARPGGVACFQQAAALIEVIHRREEGPLCGRGDEDHSVSIYRKPTLRRSILGPEREPPQLHRAEGLFGVTNVGQTSRLQLGQEYGQECTSWPGHKYLPCREHRKKQGT